MTTYAERLWGKRNTSAVLVGLQAGITPLDVSVAISQKIRKQTFLKTQIPLLGIYPKDAQSCHKDMCSTMFIAALFVIARIWKQPKCPSIEEWIRKMWYIYTMEYYTAEKNNNSLDFAGKWMELENTILSEVTQTKKDNYHMCSLIIGF